MSSFSSHDAYRKLLAPRFSSSAEYTGLRTAVAPSGTDLKERGGRNERNPGAFYNAKSFPLATRGGKATRHIVPRSPFYVAGCPKGALPRFNGCGPWYRVVFIDAVAPPPVSRALTLRNWGEAGEKNAAATVVATPGVAGFTGARGRLCFGLGCEQRGGLPEDRRREPHDVHPSPTTLPIPPPCWGV